MNKKLSVLFACAFMYVAGGVCLKWEFSTERIISRLLIWFPWFLVRKILPAHPWFPVGFPEQASLIIFGACEFFPPKMKDRRPSFKQSAVSVLSFVVLETSWFLSLNIFIKIIVGGTRDNHTLLCLVWGTFHQFSAPTDIRLDFLVGGWQTKSTLLAVSTQK